MAHTLCLEGQSIAEELRILIKQLESADWREELEHIQKRLSELSLRIQSTIQSFERAEEDPLLESLREKLLSLGSFVEERMPDMDQTRAQFREDWKSYKKKLIWSYEALAANLQLQDTHVPSLRPTNYRRNLFHIGNSLVVLALIQFTLPWTSLKWIGLGFVVWAWSMEAIRPHSPWLNNLLMKGLGSFAHPHEYHRVNSGTWYISALFLLAVFTTPLMASLAVIILGFADPAAALVGRRWGKIQLYSGRTLEGTTAFVLAGSLAAIAVMSIFSTLSNQHMLLFALAGSIPAAIAELYSKRIDDNLTIPIAAATGMSVLSYLLNLPL